MRAVFVFRDSLSRRVGFAGRFVHDLLSLTVGRALVNHSLNRVGTGGARAAIVIYNVLTSGGARSITAGSMAGYQNVLVPLT